MNEYFSGQTFSDTYLSLIQKLMDQGINLVISNFINNARYIVFFLLSSIVIPSFIINSPGLKLISLLS